MHSETSENISRSFLSKTFKNALLSLGHAELLASTLDKCARCESLQILDIVLQRVVLEVSVQVLRQGFALPTGCDSLGWGGQKLKLNPNHDFFHLPPPQGAVDFNSQKMKKTQIKRCGKCLQN